MSLYFGIDFGTTTTAFVSYDIVANQLRGFGDLKRPFPSAIVLDKIDGTIKEIGIQAINQINMFEADDSYVAIRSIKQTLKNGDVWNAGPTNWSSQQLVTEILKYGKKKIDQRYGLSTPISAVMALPVDFDYEERRILQHAAKDAEIKIQHFISEPTAALFGWRENFADIHYAAVFDWGGGTIDVSIHKISNGRVAELAKKGKRIGGDTLDNLFARYLHEKNFRQPFNDITSKQKDRILTRCSVKKIALSNTTQTDFYLPEYQDEIALDESISRDDFEAIINEKVDLVIELAKNAVSEAGLSKEELDVVLMVGGSSNIPLVRKKMNDEYGARCRFPIEPGWLIAKGAAKISSRPGAYVLSKSVGVVLSDNSFLPVIVKGQKIDHEDKVITLGLVEDSREARIIIAESFSDKIVQGEYQIIDALALTIPTVGYHFEPIEVSFKVQKDLALRVRAWNTLNGKKTETQKIYPHLKFEYKVT